MGKKAADILSRPHEQNRRIKFEHQLAGIRIYYTVFLFRDTVFGT